MRPLSPPLTVGLMLRSVISGSERSSKSTKKAMPLTSVNDIAVKFFSGRDRARSGLTKTETANDCWIVHCFDDYRRCV